MSDIIFKKQNVFNRKLYYIPTFPGAVTLFFCCWSHKLGLSETSSFPFQLRCQIWSQEKREARGRHGRRNVFVIHVINSSETQETS